jgi:uncharacterized protein (TIGR02118 family)
VPAGGAENKENSRPVSPVVAVFAERPRSPAPGRWYVPDPAATTGRDGPVAAIAIMPSAEAPAEAVDAYLVDERQQWDWSTGDEREVTQLSFVRRVDELDRAAFARHWTDVHAPLARVHHPAVVRYTQNVVLEALTPGAPDVDGIAELTFPSLDDCHHNRYDSPEGQRVVQADVASFLRVGAGWRTIARLAP